MAITKPDYSEIWASGGAVVEPSDTKKQTGWTAEVPPHQWFNWLDNRQDTMLGHINERGVPEWDGLTNYLAAGLSYVQGSDGVIYKSVAASGPSTTAQNPTTDSGNTYWKVAFAGTDNATESVPGIAKLATTAIAQAGTNDTDIMTALKVKQAIEQFSGDKFNTIFASIGGTSTVDLTTNAPNTSHVTITGSSWNITQFTVASGRAFVMVFNGSGTITNNANIVTRRSANISVAAGDSCIVRATSANTVEILVGDFIAEAAVGTRGQTWQNLTGSRSSGVTYTNTTGRPIAVSVHGTNPSSIVGISLTIAGVVTCAQGATTNASAHVFGIVPPGATYSVTLSFVSTYTWAELRA